MHCAVFTGTEQLRELGSSGPSGLTTELLVEMETTDSDYYFSIFTVNSLDPLGYVRYNMGTAGEIHQPRRPTRGGVTAFRQWGQDFASGGKTR